MEVSARAKGIRVSPRKVRQILDVVRGRRVGDALVILRHLPSPTARVVAKVVRSAAANAENNYQMAPEVLKIVRVYADEAPTLKRVRARSRGRPSPILKRSSHVTVVVDEEE